MKQNLSKTLYQHYFQNCKKLGNLWDLLNQKNITNKLDVKISIKYRGINNKNKKSERTENMYTNYW